MGGGDRVGGGGAGRWPIGPATPRYADSEALRTRPSAAEAELDDFAATALDRPRFDPPVMDAALALAGTLHGSSAALASPSKLGASRSGATPGLVGFDVVAVTLLAVLSVVTGAFLGAWLFGG